MKGEPTVAVMTRQPPELVAMFKEEAARRQMTATALLRELMAQCVGWDGEA